MSSALESQPDPPVADELVAYLDGELAPQDCRRVENRLATDDKYRQQLHELDRAWEALDSLPTTAVDDGFARTTIELACIAAEADQTERAMIAKAAKRNQARSWIAAGVAAVVIGFLAGRALLPSRNETLVADLPAIQQLSVLPFVEDVEFLRHLSNLVPAEQFAKEETAAKRNLKELQSANSRSLDERRDWVKSLSPEQKAALDERARAFTDIVPSSEERQHFRNIMADIRNDGDAVTLQKTLVAYGQWLSRRTAGQQEQLRKDLRGLPADKRAELVQKRVARDAELAVRHLSPEDVDALRREIFQIAKEKKPELAERMFQARKGGRTANMEGPLARQTTQILFLEWRTKREETMKRLTDKLSPVKAHWENLGRGQRELGSKQSQLFVWIRDAMNLKADPEELERYFASDKLSNDQRQQLLEMPRARMEAQLEGMYFRTELIGFEIPGQLSGDFGEPGRMPRGLPGAGGAQRRPDGPGPGEPAGQDGRRPRQRLGPNRAPGPGGAKERRPDDRPKNPRRPPPNQPPPKDEKQEAV